MRGESESSAFVKLARSLDKVIERRSVQHHRVLLAASQKYAIEGGCAYKRVCVRLCAYVRDACFLGLPSEMRKATTKARKAKCIGQKLSCLRILLCAPSCSSRAF